MNWRNTPIPIEHVGPVALGIIVNRSRPLAIFGVPALGQALGLPLLAAGILLVVWAMRSVDDILVDDPASLVTAGAYAHSRNPMYVAWTVIDLAVALIANSWWPILFMPVVLVFMHLWILLEERRLEQRFSDEYQAYRQRVRRYL
jgi:protein-S-isoprenylcysteine O-methyltransferase Ste14